MSLTREAIKEVTTACMSAAYGDKEAATASHYKGVVIKALELCSESYTDTPVSILYQITSMQSALNNTNTSNAYELYHSVKSLAGSYLSGADECNLALSVVYNQEAANIGGCLYTEQAALTTYYQEALFGNNPDATTASVETGFDGQ